MTKRRKTFGIKECAACSAVLASRRGLCSGCAVVWKRRMRRRLGFVPPANRARWFGAEPKRERESEGT